MTVLAAIVLAASYAQIDAAQGFLPKTVVPLSYRIDVAPDVKTSKITGHERIAVVVRSATAKIVLNALQTSFGKTTVDGAPATVTLDPKGQTATLALQHPVAAGSHTLDIDYVATLQKTTQGLFLQPYTDPNGKPAVMIASQFEATDARRMFPSFDEPAFKARFQLSAVVPKAWTAVSNTPVVATAAAGPALKRVTFAKTPKMSTYLMVLCAGKFDQVHTVSDGIRLGAYGTAGKGPDLAYALHVMDQLMPYYDTYYGVKFPIAKLDTIAIPGGFPGAMENWGGIVYAEDSVLFNPKKNALAHQRGVFGVIAHEESHQWNGDLTTLPWWDETWLNEGFATWMDVKAPDHFHPEWQSWLDQDSEVDGAMRSDAQPTTHAVYTPVRSNAAIASVFDEISYTKAGAVLRMLEAYVGEDKFHQALVRYFKTHQYASGSAADLWKDLSASSGKNVAPIAHNWIYEKGFPLVTVATACMSGKRNVTLAQHRYWFDTALDPGSTVWEIPLNVQLDGRKPQTQPVLFAAATQTIDGGSCDAPLVINGDQTGYYRVAYDAATQALQRDDFLQLSAADRIGLLVDSWAFASSGRKKVDAYLGYVEADAKDTDPHVIGTVLDDFDRMLAYEKDKPGEAAFKKYLIARVGPLVTQFGGWDGTGMNDDQLDVRNHALQILANCGDAATLDEGRKRFAAFVEDPSSFTPLNRDAVLAVAGMGADAKIYGELLAMGMKAVDQDDQQRYLVAAFSAKDEALAQQSLQMSLKLPPALAPFASFIVSSVGTEHPDMAWAFLTAHTDKLFSAAPTFFKPLFITGAVRDFWRGIPAEKIEAYLHANIPADSGGEIAKTMVSIRANQQLASRLVPQIDTYVASWKT
jgi:aminopeptidase N